jgi:hypothetical protein
MRWASVREASVRLAHDAAGGLVAGACDGGADALATGAREGRVDGDVAGEGDAMADGCPEGCDGGGVDGVEDEQAATRSAAAVSASRRRGLVLRFDIIR